MLYKAIGLMSGSSLDGLDIVFASFHENGGKWTYTILQADCYPYSREWQDRLRYATQLSARDYQLLHTEYGHYLGQQVNRFIDAGGFHYQVALIASHGHTSFHIPGSRMTAQLGDGAAIAAETRLPVVSDLRALDVAFGGQGAPIVPIGEKLLLGDYAYFLNLGGIANITFNGNEYVAFDICAANRVLNMLANDAGKDFDEGGKMAESGQLNETLLTRLNQLPFYQQPFPKSLANEFGTETVYPLIRQADCSIPDALRTYTEHIAVQTVRAIETAPAAARPAHQAFRLLATGGGALNQFMVSRLEAQLQKAGIKLVVPDNSLINYKEALIMALIGVLRWREEYNVLASVTGAARNSIGGALWLGQEA